MRVVTNDRRWWVADGNFLLFRKPASELIHSSSKGEDDESNSPSFVAFINQYLIEAASLIRVLLSTTYIVRTCRTRCKFYLLCLHHHLFGVRA